MIAEDAADGALDVADGESAVDRRNRGGGTVEIVFWHEDVQALYEMELWGVLYAPDVKVAVYVGNYVENIHFNIETASRRRR